MARRFYRLTSHGLKCFVGGLLLLAILIMLAGVVLRYLSGPLSAALGVEHLDSFWVEETGELILGWLTFVGAGIGVLTRSHFALPSLVGNLPRLGQVILSKFAILLAGVFGILLAWVGYRLALLNEMLTTPALGISLSWEYSGLIVGGLLMAICAAVAIVRPNAGPAVEHTAG